MSRHMPARAAWRAKFCALGVVVGHELSGKGDLQRVEASHRSNGVDLLNGFFGVDDT
jgi:hypothetical protein